MNSLDTLVTMNGRNSVFAQNAFRHFKWQICDYLKKIKVSCTLLFFHLGFLSWTLAINKRARGRDWKNILIPLFQLGLLTNIQIFFIVLQLRWLPCIFNRSACCNQTVVTRMLLNEIYPPLGISIWIIWFIAFIRYYSSLTEKQWIWTGSSITDDTFKVWHAPVSFLDVNPFRTDKTAANGNLGLCLNWRPQAKCR